MLKYLLKNVKTKINKKIIPTSDLPRVDVNLYSIQCMLYVIITAYNPQRSYFSTQTRNR